MWVLFVLFPQSACTFIKLALMLGAVVRAAYTITSH